MKTLKITDDCRLTTLELLQKVKTEMGAWWVWNDDKINELFPTPKEPTTREFNFNENPDGETMNKSADQIDPEGSKGMTLREYALAQLQFHKETGKYLDKKGWTLLTGSRLPHGKVACGRWYPRYRKVEFSCDDSDYSNPTMGARLAISPVPCTLNPLENRISELEKQVDSLRKFLIF